MVDDSGPMLQVPRPAAGRDDDGAHLRDEVARLDREVRDLRHQQAVLLARIDEQRATINALIARGTADRS